MIGRIGVAVVCWNAAVAQPTVRGRIVDPAQAAIGGAEVRLVQLSDSVTRRRSASEPDGTFAIEAPPGAYRLLVRAPGFRVHLVGIRTKSATDLDVREITLPIAGCDAPGVICDYFGTEDPDWKSVIKRGSIEVFPDDCLVDLDGDEQSCWVTLDAPPGPPPRDKVSDFRIRSHDHQIPVESRNGARFTQPNATDALGRGAAFDATSIRIDGLGPGSDFWVRTNQGHTSHVFLTSEADATQKQITFHFVTQK